MKEPCVIAHHRLQEAKKNEKSPAYLDCIKHRICPECGGDLTTHKEYGGEETLHEWKVSTCIHCRRVYEE
jgi:hypothetical protein